MTPKLKQKEINTFSIFPAFVAGLSDGINPLAIAALAAFLFFLFQIGTDKRVIQIFGISFLGGMFVVTLIYLLGFFDTFLGSLKFQFFLRNCILIVAGLSVVFGAINFFDWGRCLKSKDKAKLVTKWPKILTSPDRTSSGKINRLERFKLILLGIVSSSGIVFLGSLWPPRPTLTILYYDFLFPGKEVITLFAFILYCVTYMIPMILLFLLTVYVICLKKNIQFLRKSMSTVKIVTSAIFIATGAGVFYLYF